MRMNKNSRMRAVGLSSAFALVAVLGLAVFCPFVENGASAADCPSSANYSCTATFNVDFALFNDKFPELPKDDTDASDGEIAAYKRLIIDFVLNSALELEMSDIPAIETQEIQPLPTGRLATGETEFTVKSNSSSTVVYVFGHDGITTMNGTKEGNTAKIMSIASALPSSQFEIDTWGYQLRLNGESLNDYSAITASKDGAVAKNVGSGTNTLQLGFAALVSTAMPADTYTGTVDVQVVADPYQTSKNNMLYDQLGRIDAIQAARRSAAEAELEADASLEAEMVEEAF